MSIALFFTPGAEIAQAVAHGLAQRLGSLADAVSTDESRGSLGWPDLVVLGTEVGHQRPMEAFVAAHEVALRGLPIVMFTIWPRLPPVRDGLGTVRQTLGSAVLIERPFVRQADGTVDETAVDAFADELRGLAGVALPQPELRRRIEQFLTEQRVAVLATSVGDEPRATPVEYRADGLRLIIQTEGGRKLMQIRENPRVSVAIYDPASGEGGVYRSVQLTGLARVLAPGSAEARAAATLYPTRDRIEPGIHADDHRAIGHDRWVIEVEIVEATLIDTTLRQAGYRVRHNWTGRPADGP